MNIRHLLFPLLYRTGADGFGWGGNINGDAYTRFIAAAVEDVFDEGIVPVRGFNK